MKHVHLPAVFCIGQRSPICRRKRQIGADIVTLLAVLRNTTPSRTVTYDCKRQSHYCKYSHNKCIVEKLTNMVTGTQLTTTNEQRKYTG